MSTSTPKPVSPQRLWVMQTVALCWVISGVALGGSVPPFSSGIRAGSLPGPVLGFVLPRNRAVPVRQVEALQPSSAADVAGLSDVPEGQNVQLARFRFDSGTFLTDDLRAPRVNRDVPCVGSFDGGCASFGRVGQLAYPVSEGGRRPTVSLGRGTIRLLYRPDWTCEHLGGQGPEGPAVLIAAGSENDYWCLRFDDTGDNLSFVRRVGATQTVLATVSVINPHNRNVSFELRRGLWCGIVLSYEEKASRLQILNATAPDGLDVILRDMKGSGVGVPAGAGRDEQRLWVGAAPGGGMQAQGQIDELETFSGEVNPLTWMGEFERAMRAVVSTAPLSVELQWKAWPSLKDGSEARWTIKRRRWGESEWTVLSRGTSGWSYRDTPDLVFGSRYEYVVELEGLATSVQDRYLEVALDAPPTDQDGRGTLLIAVDETLSNAPALRAALAILKTDLVGYGWQVVERSAPRHDDAVWSNNPGRIAATRAMVDAVYAGYPDLHCVYLIGHVAIPMSGSVNPDGHGRRPFPADMYYGDTVRALGDWTDLADLPANTPRDGRFDQNNCPSPVEVPVGRVDLSGMSAFAGSETDLLVRYLEKVHRYRAGVLRFNGGWAGFSSAALQDRGLGRHAFACGRAVESASRATLQNVSLFRASDSARFLFAFEYDKGHHTAIHTADARYQWSTADLAGRKPQGAAAVIGLHASYLGFWASPNNFMRAVLGRPDSGLAVLYLTGMESDVNLQPLGCGRTLGETWGRYLSTLEPRDLETRPQNGSLCHSVLGDPALELYRQEPVSDLEVHDDESSVVLTWSDPAGERCGYHVYRSVNGPYGPFLRLTEIPSPTRQFVDRTPPPGGKSYMVRACNRVETGCGVFRVLSPGLTAALR